MSLRTHGEGKYRTSQALGGVAEWEALRVEHRHIAEGSRNGPTSECTELVYILSGKALARIGLALHDLLRRDTSAVDRIFADGMRTALAAHLMGNCSVDRWRPPTRRPALDAKRLKRVLDFVEARLADDISLDDLAAAACLSRFHFLRLFHETTGLSPHRYVTSRRIQAAQAMLARHDASLVQIAFDTGFSSQASFTRVFRKWTGSTPGQYRKHCLR